MVLMVMMTTYSDYVTFTFNFVWLILILTCGLLFRYAFVQSNFDDDRIRLPPIADVLVLIFPLDCWLTRMRPA